MVSVGMDDLSVEDASRIRESMGLIESIQRTARDEDNSSTVYSSLGTAVGMLLAIAAVLVVVLFKPSVLFMVSAGVATIAGVIVSTIRMSAKKTKSRQQKTDEDAKALAELMHPCSACHDFVMEYAENDPVLKAALVKYNPSLETPATV